MVVSNRIIVQAQLVKLSLSAPTKAKYVNILITKEYVHVPILL